MGDLGFCKTRAGYSWFLGRRVLVGFAFFEGENCYALLPTACAWRLVVNPFKNGCADTSGGNVSRETLPSPRNERKFLEVSQALAPGEARGLAETCLKLWSCGKKRGSHAKIMRNSAWMRLGA